MYKEKQILIDADQFVYYKYETIEDIKLRIDSTIEKICLEMGCCNYSIIISSKTNKRKIADSTYKENRKDNIKPQFYKEVYDYLNTFNATTIENEEADDIIAYFKRLDPNKYIIASQDKDILYNFSGDHFDLYYGRMNKITVTREQADLFYHTQLLIGDAVDNIPRLEINDKIIKRFNLSKSNAMTDKTAMKIFNNGLKDGLNFHEIVKLCYTLSDAPIERYFSQINKIYMGLDKIELEELKYNTLITQEEIYIEIKYEYDFVITFGKYKNKMLSFIEKTDPQYLKWIIENSYDENTKTMINDYLNNKN